MRFDIGFVDNIQTVNIAKRDKKRIGRIVRRTHAVYVQLFHERYVAFHIVKTHGITLVKVGVMMIDAFDFYRCAVNKENPVLYFNCPKSRKKTYGQFVFAVRKRNINGIEHRRFGSPFLNAYRAEVKLGHSVGILRNTLYFRSVGIGKYRLYDACCIALCCRR